MHQTDGTASVRLRRKHSPAGSMGNDLRQARIRCEFELRVVARELGVPARDLRAVEWDRLDLLKSDRYARKLIRRYEEWLAPAGVPRPVRQGTDTNHSRATPVGVRPEKRAAGSTSQGRRD